MVFAGVIIRFGVCRSLVALVLAGLRARCINESLLALVFAGFRARFINESLFVLVWYLQVSLFALVFAGH